MTRIKKLFPLIAVLFILSGSLFTVHAAETKYSSKPYYIENYNVKVNVLENNTLEITEHIDAFFNTERHGIVRYIPVENRIERNNGTTETVHARIKHIKVNEAYEGYFDDNNNYVLQIGDADQTITGKHSYTISYEYIVGRDMHDGYDELYLNIIGTGWDTNIENVSFEINMPKAFDQSKIGFSTGAYGTSGTDSVQAGTDGNMIYGTLSRPLNAYEGLTMRLELEDGYFTFDYLSYYLRHIFMVALPLAALLVVVILWIKFGRDKKIVDVVEFYPPENMNSAEAAYWFSGFIQNEKTIGLLIELANEGYLEIEEKSKNSFVIRKIKDYAGNDIYKKIFFNGLFKSKNEVKKSDLQDKFYKYPEEIVKKISASDYTKIYNRRSLSMRAAGWLVSIAAGILSYIIFQLSFSTRTEFYCLCAGIVICIIAFILSFFIRQRTNKGYEIKQKINGFKLFLETAEKERLEEMAEENPKYFYDVLPYAYALGVSDVWCKKFENITIEPPNWFTGGHYSSFTTYYLVHSVMSSAISSMTSIPETNNSSSGGFSSGGGGFSGGGIGGGGGGSW